MLDKMGDIRAGFFHTSDSPGIIRDLRILATAGNGMNAGEPVEIGIISIILNLLNPGLILDMFVLPELIGNIGKCFGIMTEI